MCTYLKYCKFLIKFTLKFLLKMGLGLFKYIYKFTHSKVVWLMIVALLFVLYWPSGYENSNNKRNPVIVWWTSNFPDITETKECSRYIKCDVYSNNITSNHKVDAYLFYGSDINSSDLPSKNPNVLWGLFHEESPRNQEVLMHENMLSLFNFSATFSRFSDVPVTLQYLESFEDITSTKYYVPTPVKNKLLNEIAPILYLQTDCETSTERDKYVKELMKYISVDSYGKCLNNRLLPRKFITDYLNNLNEDEFLKFVARYKFVIAIENGVCEDYVTEKFWRAIKVGSVPIYFGSPSVRDWFPNNESAILLNDFPTPEILSKHLKQLLDNDFMYERYLEHKTKKLISNKRLIKEMRERPYQNDTLETFQRFICFICEKLHDKSNIGVNVVSKRHYDCPEPISALSLNVNPSNHWVQSWKYAKRKADVIYKKFTSN